MAVDAIQGYIRDYGVWILFLMVAVEYLGIPGYPGGILPIIGILSRFGLMRFSTAAALSVVASSFSMVLVYMVGLRFSAWSAAKLEKAKKFSKAYQWMRFQLREHGAPAMLLARQIPVVRIFASAIAGILGMEWRGYCFYSFVGNFIYVLGTIGLGYFFTSMFV